MPRGGDLEFESLFEFTDTPVLMSDSAGSIRQANSAALDLLRAQAAWIHHQPLVRFVQSKDRATFRRRLVQLARFRAPLSWPMELRRADGSGIASHVTARAFSDGAAGAWILWQLREQSARPDAHIAEAPYRAIVEGVRDHGLLLLDLEGRIVSWNPAAETLLGYTAREIVGEPYAKLFVPEDRPHDASDADLRLAIHEGRSRAERWHLCRDGRRIRCATTVARVDDGRRHLEGFSVVIRDVTDAWRTSQALIDREEQLRMVLLTTQMGDWEWDVVRDRLSVSAEYNRIMGLPAELRETTYGAIQQRIAVTDRGVVDSTIRAAMRDRSDFDVEFRVHPPGGQVRWISAFGRAYYDPLGNPVRVIGVVRDITERRRIDQEAVSNRAMLDAADKTAAILQERNRMAREIHDTLAQGFTGIFIQLEAAEDALATSPLEAPMHIGRARELALDSLAEARRSVRALRSQALEGRTLEAALQYLIDQTVGSGMDAAPTLTVKGEPPPLTESIEMNLLRIGQEALANALRHSGASRIAILLSYRCDGVRLKIADDGVGFKVAPEPAAPNDGGGMGLLGIVERAHEIKGRARITSRPGNGTIVDVFVPMRRRHNMSEIQDSLKGGGR